MRQFFFVISTLVCLLCFQNCGSSFSTNTDLSSSGAPMMAAIQSSFQGVTSVNPIENFSMTETKLSCLGECTVTFAPATSMGGFTNIACDGDLRIGDDELACTHNLTLEK